MSPTLHDKSQHLPGRQTIYSFPLKWNRVRKVEMWHKIWALDLVAVLDYPGDRGDVLHPLHGAHQLWAQPGVLVVFILQPWQDSILMHKCLMVRSPLSLDWSPGRSWPARCSGGHRVVCSWAGQPRDVCWTHFPLLHGDEHPGGDLGPGSHCCIRTGQSPCNTRNMTWLRWCVDSLCGAWIWVKWCR